MCVCVYVCLCVGDPFGYGIDDYRYPVDVCNCRASFLVPVFQLV